MFWSQIAFSLLCGGLVTVIFQSLVQKLRPRLTQKSFSQSGSLKLVLCVRNDLKMQKGKMCAQCSHASVGLVTDLLAVTDSNPNSNNDLLYHCWADNGQATIVTRVESEQELLDIEVKAKAAGLPTYLVIDAGRTQVAPNTATVLAVGPASGKLLNKLTGHLKLM